jgi:PleD family two-component response regulator
MAALGPATLDFVDRINAKTWMTGRKPVLGRAFGTGPGAGSASCRGRRCAFFVMHSKPARERIQLRPRARSRIRVRSLHPEGSPSVSSRHRGAPLRMLIVEDNPHVADVLIDECEMALGAEVVAVETGDMALQFLARSPPTLALVELALPDMSGFEVARCAANNDVPAIVMSGHPEKMLLCQ